MSDTTDVCTLCNSDITATFVDPRPAPVVINADLHWNKPCFVADEVHFIDKGRLIFDVNREIHEYAVICRKLVISGGNKPITVNPCNPSDPGTRYNTNVITWNGRLKSADPGPDASPPTVPPNSTQDGGPGGDGAAGQPGNSGGSLGYLVERQYRPIKLVVMVMQIEFINSGYLVIDWAGQDGGDGGRGQNGGKGHKGVKGSDGKDASWPSSGCDVGTGTGGDGGPGGQGGKGGIGGDGGASGQLIIITMPDYYAASGVLNDPAKVSLVTQSVGGKGGPGGHGGDGGAGGNPGKPSSECGLGNLGNPGASFVTLFADPGNAGNPGSSLPPIFEVLGQSCSKALPAPMPIDASNVFPQIVRRCYSGSGNASVSITGQGLDQVVSVTSSIPNVTASIINLTSNDTQLDLTVTAAANSGSGLGDLILNYPIPGSAGPSQTIPNAINVMVCEATGIAPNSGAQGSTVSVTITGSSFDPSAGFHDVTVSSLAVNPVNIAVVDENTMTCDLIIGGAALKGKIDVTVKAGTCQYTLPQAFTVT